METVYAGRRRLVPFMNTLSVRRSHELVGEVEKQKDTIEPEHPGLHKRVWRIVPQCIWESHARHYGSILMLVADTDYDTRILSTEVVESHHLP